MITIDNLRPLLATLGYNKTKGATEVWIRSFEASSSMIIVDFEEETIRYPEGLKVNRETTTNFSQPENFVVLECITRLLSLGYTPRQLELEKSTPKGHGEGGGYCDIIIQDNEGKVFALVECKTMGSTKRSDEFHRAWSKMKKDGGQLFNYFNTFRQATALCLYASDWVGGRCIYQSYIVSIQDDEGYIKKNKCRSYADVEEKKEGKESYFKVWRDTYALDHRPAGLFEEGTKPFTIGQHVFRAEDLKDIIDKKGIKEKYLEYATIMRQHNVSGRENAFDKLVNLFLAKLVDETRNREALKFHWGGVAADDYYRLHDRLQKMYSEGMKDFLGEQVTYVDELQISAAFTYYLGNLDATKDAVLKHFREQKFYTNNDFAFLDVHNETLFKQNAEILKKVVCMLQDIRLRTDKPNQFLGDLFEDFLDQGVKQNEGQFFTPLPIVRFIVSSLPLEKLYSNRNGIPSVIDYACGAGHFLNEYAQQIKPFIPILGATEQECYNAIYGIEKEYRLSKVAKVSAFMYGQESINIIHHDALKKHERIREGEFSVLIANPPYSVKGFLETLTEEERLPYKLNSYVSEVVTNANIELFFLERASQLLQSDGVAAIILPSSVLSNKDKIYSRARELMLREFEVIAIAEFGSATFGKTGTNTITLFLKKRDANILAKDHYRNRVNAWFSGDFAADSHYKDASLLGDYCSMQGIDLAQYKAWLRGRSSDELWECELFKSYQKTFAETKPVIPTAVREIEREKLYYYLLAKSNEQPILIIKSPADTKECKRFLGYGWSGRRGSEGIQYIGRDVKNEGEKEPSIDSIQTPLFNPRDLSDASRLNSLVRSCFLGEAVLIPEELKSYCSTLRLTDMLDFKRPDWDAAIRTTVRPQGALTVQSKYPVVTLGAFPADIRKGKSITQKKAIEGPYKVVAGGVSYAYYHNEYNRPEGTITISASGANAGYVNQWNEKIFASDCTTVNVGDPVSASYVYNYLKSRQDEIFMLARGAAQPHVYPDDIKSLPIPRPSIEVQQAIVDECAVVDAEYESSRAAIDGFRAKIAGVIALVDDAHSNYPKLSIGSLCSLNSLSIDPKLTPNKEYTYVDIDSVSNATGKYSLSQKILGATAPSRARRIAPVNSTVISTVRPNLRGFIFVDRELEDTLFTTGFAILKAKDNKILADRWLYYLFMYSPLLMSQMEQAMPKGSYPSINAAAIKAFSIPVPSLQEQERIIQEIESYEAEIRKAEAVMQGVEARKSAILQKYLG